MEAFRKENIKTAGIIALVAVLYVIFGKLGLHFAVVEPNATAFWIPTGIAIAALLLGGYRLWPAIFIGAFITNITTAGTVGTSLAIAIGNTLEALVAAYLVNKFANGVYAFEEPQDVFRFVFFAGIVATAISATFGVTSVVLAGLAPWASYPATWITWWLGDMGGAVIIAPFILLWSVDYKIVWDKTKTFEAIFLCVLLIVFGFLGFRGRIEFTYLFTPILVWGAFRFTQRETATSLFALTAISLWGTLQGFGPFAENTGNALNASLLLLEASMVTTFVTMMALTAIVQKHKKTEHMMAAQNEKMVQEKAIDDAIFASVGDGLIVTNQEAKILIASRHATALLGWQEKELIGKNYAEAMPMQDEEGNIIPFEKRPLYRVLKNGERIPPTPLSLTRYYMRKDGSRFLVSFTKTPVLMRGQVVGAVEIFRDVTHGKNIDQAKSDFVSLAAHQLRTPISIISLYTELLERQNGLLEKHNERECMEYAHEIHEATKRMSELINDLLNVSRIDTETLAITAGAFDLKQVIDGIFREMRPKISAKSLMIAVHYPDHMPELNTDAQLLGMAIQNLVSNAIKYTPAKGKVTLDVHQTDEAILISVSDTGYGIPKNQQGEIFKKLFRADNARQIDGEGSGLGLYIVKSVIERLGGEISFESKEDKGSTFAIHLPLAIVTKSPLA